jgi:phosphatidylserine/phosphatidylglycerophosphate/cardiolipin synthase-like enzyme
MIDALFDLPPHARERLASALESGLLPSPPAPAALRSVLGGAASLDSTEAALVELARLGVSGSAAAMWIRGLASVESRQPRTDLVWSGPEVPGLHARDTRRVYDELLGSAERSLRVSTYAFFDGPRAFATLARRMDATPELRVTLLLNIRRQRGDTMVVADDETVFVTSANLTEAALDRNVELGILVRDRALALSVTAHFRGLIDRGLLAALPGE